MAHRQLGGRLADAHQVANDDLRRLDDLHRHGVVVEVLAGHAEVDVASLRLADRLVDDGEKRDHIVAHPGLDLGDLRHIEGGLADLGQSLLRDASKPRPCLGREDLDAKE